MLKINKTRQTLAVSTVYETLHDAELYAKHRAVMRVDEDALWELRYKIEDDILAELEAEA